MSLNEVHDLSSVVHFAPRWIFLSLQELHSLLLHTFMIYEEKGTNQSQGECGRGLTGIILFDPNQTPGVCCCCKSGTSW